MVERWCADDRADHMSRLDPVLLAGTITRETIVNAGLRLALREQPIAQRINAGTNTAGGTAAQLARVTGMCTHLIRHCWCFLCYKLCDELKARQPAPALHLPNRRGCRGRIMYGIALAPGQSICG